MTWALRSYTGGPDAEYHAEPYRTMSLNDASKYETRAEAVNAALDIKLYVYPVQIEERRVNARSEERVGDFHLYFYRNWRTGALVEFPPEGAEYVLCRKTFTGTVWEEVSND